MNQASNYLMTGKVAQRIGSLHPNIAPYGELFQTKDGATITLAIGSDVHFSKLCKHLDLNALPQDPRFHTNTNRVQHRKLLAELLQQKIIGWDTSKLLAALQADFVPAGKVKALDEVFADQEAADQVRTETIAGQETKRVTSIAFKWE
jgi:crotonobetainyl-CoA:carnitine CoA-transferase CaiB-like acyl-CoA transferase